MLLDPNVFCKNLCRNLAVAVIVEWTGTVDFRINLGFEARLAEESRIALV